MRERTAPNTKKVGAYVYMTGWNPCQFPSSALKETPSNSPKQVTKPMVWHCVENVTR